MDLAKQTASQRQRKAEASKPSTIANPDGSLTSWVIVTLDGERHSVEVAVSVRTIQEIARRAVANATGYSKSGGIAARAKKL